MFEQFFEVKDSDMFGGTGTNGYIVIAVEEKENTDMEAYRKHQISAVASMCGVLEEKVIHITKEAYKMAVEEDNRVWWNKYKQEMI